MSDIRGALQRVSRHNLFWPALALVLLVVANVIYRPGFVKIEMLQGHLYGSLVDILRQSAPLIIIALGMTLVIATGGIDLSVGSVVAIGGAVAVSYVSGLDDQNSVGGVLVACLLAAAVGAAFGLWNGILVAGIGIAPIIATLILMVAGRGIAQLITEGQIITINSAPYKLLGAGFWLTLPFALFIAAALILLTALLTRRTALGMFVESVGGNAEASRLAGIRSRRFILLVYVFSGFCAGTAGLLATSDVSAADGNQAGLYWELDAILAVVIGGTSLAGGRFSLGGTVLGAIFIKTLTTTVYSMGINPQQALLFKALVVILVCLIQSPQFRETVAGSWRRRRRRPEPPAAPAEHPKVEVPA